MLAQRGSTCRSCNDVHELCRGAGDGIGAIILTEEALVPGAVEDLDALFGAQPPWSDIGLVLLTSNGNRVLGAVRAKLERRGARSVILMERPVRLLTLASTVQSVLQSRSRQFATIWRSVPAMKPGYGKRKNWKAWASLPAG